MNGFPKFDLTGQVALVTGAARGLGRAISLAMANAGADVALGLRDRNTGAELAQEIEAMGRRALPLQMDIAHLGQISSAIEDAVGTFWPAGYPGQQRGRRSGPSGRGFYGRRL